MALLPLLVALCDHAAAATAKPIQPPMNDFDFAYYLCDDGRAFQISYDSDTPKVATITTSDNNRQYVLDRQPSDSGVQFAKGDARFWTDGRKVEVEGTAKSLQNCKRKVN